MPSIVAAAVPSSAENGKKPAQSSRAAARNASSSSWSRSRSPGKPTMKLERNAADGSAARIPEIEVEEPVAVAPPLHRDA